MREIQLTQGKVALVDDEDYEALMKFTWHAVKAKCGIFYANTSVYLPPSGCKTVRMHRVIMNPPAGMVVDHIDGDGLNNQRSNIRLCTMAENVCNRRRMLRLGRSEYKGVAKARSKWKAQIKLGNKSIYLGRFDTQIAAARAYDTAALELHGEFARINGV